jgi:hypothetical protein
MKKQQKPTPSHPVPDINLYQLQSLGRMDAPMQFLKPLRIFKKRITGWGKRNTSLTHHCSGT